ncbi:Pycsar system effector family protein [Flavobacterium turcicum]|uniref:HD domain-containing protein n=1 Tax=Flavobacterium turcicum TaxID=2764718 RepID=A0ABR7JFJ2_9FLAO|nr:Pycsar system effector family protein [Flavobacterium turcicum]MBC5863248.1 HD domain-containing protein [Flavobacterium turcicum]NHL01980.1 HD domain-containing protein [Flavobacterium turcicum]
MNLIEQAKEFVEKQFKDKLSNSYTYHNISHTKDVVAAVEIIAAHEGVTEKELEMLLLAAWFHDMGYINGCQKHEESSVVFLKEFLATQPNLLAYQEQVAQLIMTTVYSYEPQNKLEKIIKDADYYHLSKREYVDSCGALRAEWHNLDQKTFSDAEWWQENLNFLANKHQYYTTFAIANWQPLKDKNKKRLQKKIDKSKSKEEIVVAENRKKEEKPDRAVDTLFRVTLNNHTTLSGIADSKANILLSVNAIIISIALSILIPKLDSPKNVHLMIPTFIMLMSSVTTIIFAILSTRPKVTKGVFSRQDIENQKVNLLFFGNFYKMPLEEYQWAMNEMMKDKDYLYNSMIKDLYYLGVVLEKKYRLLRLTYNFFMIGIIVSVIAFVIAFKMV